MNRERSDRLEQAEALWAMLDPESYPAAAFEDRVEQRAALPEHTWGAHCCVWGPERQETKEQWEIKRGYALAADKQSRELLIKAAAPSERTPYLNGVDVYNTASWPRTELVTLSQELSTTGDCVLDDRGKPVPSQRLTSGELAFVAHDVPALGAKRFTVNADNSRVDKPAVAYGVNPRQMVASTRYSTCDRCNHRTDGQGQLTAILPTPVRAAVSTSFSTSLLMT